MAEASSPNIVQDEPVTKSGYAVAAELSRLRGPDDRSSSDSGQPQTRSEGDSLLIADVTLIDGTGVPPRSGVSVLVTGDVIVAVGPAHQMIVPAGTRRIEGAGRFLIPGLWDMHVHLSKIGPTALTLFVANGVTGVRDMGSDFSEVDYWRTEIGHGIRVGPRIRTPGPILESAANVQRMLEEGVVEPVARTRLAVGGSTEATAAVESLAVLGVDFLKVRTYSSAEALVAIATAARAAGLPLAGHTEGLTPEQILDLGFSTVEHFLYPTLDDRTPEERQAIFERFAREGVAIVPTMVNWFESLSLPPDRVMAIVSDDQARLDSRRAYISEHLLADWREQAAERRVPSPIDFGPIVASTHRNLIEMRQAGVHILPGTDAAVVLIFPGFSLHDELVHLVESTGLSPMEALVAATRLSAEHSGLSETAGTIETGKLADMVLLDADPLADIHNTRRIAGVVAAGRYYDARSLDVLLHGVAAVATRTR